jgi:hypothetical protein
MFGVILVTSEVRPQGGTYLMQGTVNFTNYLPQTSTNAAALFGKDIPVVERTNFIMNFTFALAANQNTWRATVTWPPDVDGDYVFDGENYFQLVEAPDRTRAEADRRSHPVMILYRSTNGIPIVPHCMVSFLWLALGSGPVLSVPGPDIAVPWAAPIAIMPEIYSFDVLAQVLPGVPSFPSSVEFRFSERKWRHQHRILESDFPDGMLVGNYSLLKTVKSASGTYIPAEFTMVRYATAGWLLEYYHGFITNVMRNSQEDFTVDLSRFDDGLTIHDNRFADAHYPGLVFAYRFKGRSLPDPESSAMLARAADARLIMDRERRTERLKMWFETGAFIAIISLLVLPAWILTRRQARNLNADSL